MVKSIFRCCFVLALLPNIWVLPAQSDSLLTLSEIEITAPRLREEALGSQEKRWDPKALEKFPGLSLAELLANETGTYIKSYGLGSLATSSVRGGSAGHTLVLWNGLPIQSPMLGQLDLSLLEVGAAESIRFQKGGNTALWGSGAIGAVLSLNNEADFTPRLSVQSQSIWGDFGRFHQQVNIRLGNAQFQSHTKLIYKKADNDFYYYQAPGLPKRQQSNAHLLQKNILQDLFWKIGKNKQLSVHFWKQNAEREIPPTNVQTKSEAHQNDRSTRLILDGQHVYKKALLQSKVGIFDEYLDYFDDQTGLVSLSHFRTLMGELNLQKYGNKQHQFNLGATHTFTQAWADAYQDIPSEHKTAFFASWKWQGKSVQVQGNARQAIVNSSFVPLVPELSFEYQLHPLFLLKGKISKNYRLPTFNDRFWQPGGNEDLLPESGWSEELSLGTEFSKGNFLFSAALTGFNRKIDNWILWSIREGQSYWSANNISKVWSRGLEPRLSSTFRSKKLSIKVETGYDYVRATNQIAIEIPRMKRGMQLLYTPVHQAFGKISVSWKDFFIAYQHTYKGNAQGINAPLAAFEIAHLRFQYEKTLGDYRGIFFFRLNNVWNQDYQIVERRPMPGINYQFGINLTYIKQRKR